MTVKIGKEKFGDDFKQGDYLKRLKKKGTTKDLTKYKVKKIKINNRAVGGSAKAEKGSTDFGMLSVKAGIDKNPNPTKADRIAGAKMKKPQGAFLGKIFSNEKISEMFSRIKGDQAIKDPQAYRQAYNKYATAYGNEPMKNPDNQKNQENQKPQVMAKDGEFVEDHSRGGRRAIRGTKFKGVF